MYNWNKTLVENDPHSHNDSLALAVYALLVAALRVGKDPAMLTRVDVGRERLLGRTGERGCSSERVTVAVRGKV